jgi:hypothetical protein
MRNEYKTLFGKPERKRLFGRHRRGWEDNIRLYLRETERKTTNACEILVCVWGGGNILEKVCWKTVKEVGV